MATKLWAFGLMFLCTILTSIAQIFYKKGVESLSFDLTSIIFNYPIIIGLAIYIVGGIMMIVAFKGGEVSTLYPIIATSYIWVSFLSVYFFGESMNIYRWAGIFVVIIGIIFIGMGNSAPSAAKSAGAGQ